MSDLNDELGGLRPSAGKRKIIRKKKDPGNETDADGAAAQDGEGEQVVHSAAEADALVKRLRQLEGENASLARSLAKICDNNASLSAALSKAEKKTAELAAAPLQDTSVLRSLFEPDKTGWFGGSKSAARDQLEKLCEALQAEFTEYKSTHPTTSDEFQAVVTELHNAHSHAAELSKIIDEQQKALSSGPYACVVRVIPFSGDVDGVTGKELQSMVDRLRSQNDQLQRDLVASRAEVGEKVLALDQCQRELNEIRRTGGRGSVSESGGGGGGGSPAALAASLNGEMEMQRLKDDNARLEAELSTLRGALATEEKLRAIKTKACEDALAKLDAARDELDAMRARESDGTQAASASTTVELQRCERDLAAARAENAKIQGELQALRTQLASVTSSFEKTNAALQGKIEEQRAALSEKDRQLSRSVAAEAVSKLEFEKNALQHELTLYQSRVARLEAAKSAVASGNASFDDGKALEALNSQKEYIARLEFEREQWQTQLDQAKSYAVERDREAQRIERASAEDKQRVGFLLKKCATVTAEQRSTAAQLDTLKENYEKLTLELKQERRKTEELAETREKLEAARRERQQMEDRLRSVDELEEKLVKAKETIAFMELAQSSSINMSQFAALQAEKTKLENSVAPLRKQLAEAQKEVERLKATTDAQQSIVVSQKTNVQGWQDQVNTLTESEARLREKTAKLVAENERLTKLNESLEQQMTDMQGGIREMAVQMEKERTNARRVAEENHRKEIEDLKARLESANSTIGSFHASEGQFVAEGLYQSVVAERDRLAEELKRKTAEVEKHKSEILIYRQTITDLETENDEHVKEIETLQSRYQKDRSGLNDRLAQEQKRCAELNGTVEALQAQMALRDEQETRNAEALTEAQDRLARQKRAFEDKCRREEELLREIEALRQGSGSGPATAAAASTPPRALSVESPAASPYAPSSPVASPGVAVDRATADSDAAAQTQYRMQSEIDKLRAEVRRLNLKIKSDYDDDQRTIQMLQLQLKSRMSPGDRSAYEAEVKKVAALRKSNDSLQQEVETLKREAAKSDGGAGSMYHEPFSASPLPNNSSNNNNNTAQLHQELEAERARVAELEEEIALLEERVQELEDELEKARQDTGDGGHDDPKLSHGNNEDGGGPKKKRVKKVRKVKKSLAEQVGGVDGVDVLATSPVSAAQVPPESAQELSALREKVERMTRELQGVQEENVTLKQTIAELTEELAQAREDLTAAENDMDSERTELQQRIHELEQQQQQLAQAQHGRASPNASFSRAANIQQLEMQLRSAKDENDKLLVANKELENRLRAKGPAATAAPADEPPDTRRMRKQIQQKDAEIRALTEQLMPTKNKLAEYMAMADRLGLQYPFPPELEGATVLRLQAANIRPGGRALSAPGTTTTAATAGATSPTPRRPPRRAARPTAAASSSAPSAAAGAGAQQDEFDLL